LTDIERRIAESVSKTHPQLAPLVILEIVSVLARWGLIVFGPKASGKSTSQNALVRNMRGIEFFRCDAGFSPAYIKEQNAEHVFEEKSLVVIVDDLTTWFVTSAATTSFQFISQLQYAKSYFGRIRQHPTIERADVATLAAGTVWCCARAVEYGVWDSHVSDRFLRIYLMYYDFPRGEDDLPKFCSEPPFVDCKFTPVPWEEMEWKVSPEKMKRVIAMLRSQLTEPRSVEFGKRMLTAHAWFCGRKEVLDSDADWFLLYTPWIVPEKHFIVKVLQLIHGAWQSKALVYSDVYAELLFWCSKSMVTDDDLQKNTKYPLEMTKRRLMELIQYGFVKEDNGKYFVSDYLGAQLRNLHKTFLGNFYKEVQNA
jgi:hypothetical protein